MNIYFEKIYFRIAKLMLRNRYSIFLHWDGRGNSLRVSSLREVGRKIRRISKVKSKSLSSILTQCGYVSIFFFI